MKRAVLLLCIFTLVHCSPVRFVEPLSKGERAIGFNLGGPLIKFSGVDIPIPFSSIYGGYGYTDDMTLFAGVHLTAALYKTAQLAVGTSYRLSHQRGLIPHIGTQAVLHSITALPGGATRLYPQGGLNLGWKYNKRWFSYAGLRDGWIYTNRDGNLLRRIAQW